jgi:hypothetical protein
MSRTFEGETILFELPIRVSRKRGCQQFGSLKHNGEDIPRLVLLPEEDPCPFSCPLVPLLLPDGKADSSVDIEIGLDRSIHRLSQQRFDTEL